jgi:hypothetical protein
MSQAKTENDVDTLMSYFCIDASIAEEISSNCKIEKF